MADTSTPDGIVQSIRDLLAKSSNATYEYPSMASVVVNHPGVLSYQLKTAPHYQQDMRRAQFLDGVAGMVDEIEKDRWEPSGLGPMGATRYEPQHNAHVLSEGLGRAEREFPGLSEGLQKRDTLRGPYWNRGVLAYGQPLRAGADVMQAFASTNLNLGRKIGAGLGLHGQTPKESEELARRADEDFGNSLDRLLLGAPSILGGKLNPMQAAWELERAVEESRPVGDMSFAIDASNSPRVAPRLMSVPYEKAALSGLTQGADLTDPLLGRGLASDVAGMAVDVATDPATGVVDAVRALSRGLIGKGVMGLASEAALPSTFIGISEAGKRAAQRALDRRGR